MTRPGSPSGWAREVVAQRAAIVTAVTALVHLVVVLWALPPTLEAQVPAAVGTAIDLLGMLVAVLWARAGVTPADPDKTPVSSNGVTLVESI